VALTVLRVPCSIADVEMACAVAREATEAGEEAATEALVQRRNLQGRIKCAPPPFSTVVQVEERLHKGVQYWDFSRVRKRKSLTPVGRQTGR